MTETEVELVVKDALRSDVHKDTVRVHWEDRGGFKNGSIVAVTVNGKTRPLVMRGLNDDRKGQILFDFVLRDEFHLKNDQRYKFVFKSVNPFAQVGWACKHSDPGIRVAAWIAIWSAVVGTILGVIGLIV